MRVMVLHQSIDESRADEVDTLLQAQEILALLQKSGNEVLRATCSDIGEIEAAVCKNKPDAVFNLIESMQGSDSFAYMAAGALEAMKVPFTGNPALALMLSSDKPKLKNLLSGGGISVPRGLEAGQHARYIVKSVSEHASFGIDAKSVVSGKKSAQQLIAAKAVQYGGQWLAEEYIDGRELNLALLETGNGVVLLPPAEIIFDGFADGVPHIVDYSAKWDETSYEYNHTPRRFCDASDDMHKITGEVWKVLGLRGYARIDLRMDNNGKLWVIDVNPNPCLSSDAGFMAAAKQHGLTAEDVIQIILESRIDANKTYKNIAV